MSVVHPHRGRTRRQRQEMRTAYLFLLPALLVYLVFVFWPVVQSIYYGFFEWSGLGKEMTFVGLRNYVEMFTTDAVFLQSLGNSLISTLVLAVVPTALGLGFAALFSSLRGGGVYRSVIFLPYLVAMVAVGTIWSWIYNPRIDAPGILLQAVGLQGWMHDWLGDKATALAAALVPGVWRFTGFAIVIFYAAIQSIPVDLFEAARVDGASGWQSFWKITLPLVRQAMIIVVVWMTMDALKLFDLIFTLTRGNPNHATEMIATWMFANTFRHYKMGYGAAMSVVLFLIILGFSIIYIRWATRGEEEA
ncbi:MAG TPA: sugar ABC transporter permease [Anaerolineae bacterium]|nr:sugar ABC transporter permease [Anaerolineae bacterium]